MATIDLTPLPFEDAIKFFKDKGYRISPESWRDVWQEMHNQVFTLARVTAMEVLEDVREELQRALDTGVSLQNFKKEIIPRLAAKGWYAPPDEPDIVDGVKRITPWRLDNIFRTNLQSAYNTGHYQQMIETAHDRPFWQYVAVMDIMTRPSHAAHHGKVYRFDHPFWDKWYPPNGFQCRCTVRTLSGRQLEQYGLTEQTAGTDLLPDEGFRYNPGREKWQPDFNKYGPEARQKIFAALRKKDAFDPEELELVPNSQKGSMPGGLYKDPAGRQYYAKFYPDAGQARSEYAANGIYRLLGVDVPELRLAEMADPGGQRKLALISKWRDDISRISSVRMLEHPEELARIFQASALVKNWDVVGLEFDNLLLSQKGKLTLVDAGGSLKYRARGQAKPFEAVPHEVKTYLDPKTNPQAAQVFKALFDSDPWLEADGARRLLALNRRSVEKIFKEAGFAREEIGELSGTLFQRRDWMVKHYDLENKLTYEGFGSHLKKFRKWGTQAYSDATVHANGAISSSNLMNEGPALVKKFERYVNRNIDRKGKVILKKAFEDWSGSSSAPGGAALKKWAESRFGVQVSFHRGNVTEDFQVLLNRAGLPQEKIFELFDAEYEFHQYYLRRLHRYDPLVIERGIEIAEFDSSFREGVFTPNAVASTTTSATKWTRTEKRVRMTTRVEDIVKTWYQGPDYLSYYTRELEYVTIGRAKKAEMVK